jgi:hypothetical protein
LDADAFCPAAGAKTRNIQMFLLFRALPAGQINANKFRKEIMRANPSKTRVDEQCYR